MVAQRGGPVSGAALLLASTLVPNLLAPIAPAGATAAAPPWAFMGLPQQKPPATQFEVLSSDGGPLLRIASDAGYGQLVHPLSGPPAAATRLSWRWRVAQWPEGADLRHKAGDDTAIKVCAMFEQPLARLPFVERQKLRLARSLSGSALPAATLCYVWDAQLAAGSVLPNAYSDRLRWWVLRSGSPGPWQQEQRDLQADFRRAFADELGDGRVPPLSAIAVGADSDNGGGRARADLADLVLQP
jgi:hypothetical protein